MIIQSSEIKIEQIPKKGSKWKAISNFALSFDIQELSNNLLNLNSEFHNLSISELRYILYVEQRRYNHFGTEPNSLEINKIYDLLNQIIIKIQTKS